MTQEEDKDMSIKVNTEKDEHIDPVCGMTVSGDSKFQFVYSGEPYYFCSQHCLLAFKEHPEQYLKGGGSKKDKNT